MTTLTAVEQQQDLASLIDLYLLRCQVEGKSPNTITAYRETLTLFERIAREEGFPEEVRTITPAHIYAYLGRIAQLRRRAGQALADVAPAHQELLWRELQARMVARKMENGTETEPHPHKRTPP